MDSLEKVSAELALYKHPFFEFSVIGCSDGVEVSIRPKVANVHTDAFRFTVADREIDHPQFRWSFQGLLYGSMNDFMVELFTHVPGDRNQLQY